MLIVYGLFICMIVGIILDLKRTKETDKKLEEQYRKIMEDCKYTQEISNLKAAIHEANLCIYETPTGKYILVPREGNNNGI